ncbi:hypothetical protein [Kitasatospora purpeofusca]|uniref:hypothetical protein n=1 Tax=Kitasatospora purpeofusca TaxID=67352 RepID=UPI003809B265
MPSPVNSLPPSLLNELAEMNRRLAAIERAPAPINTFDRYPTAEWDPTARGVVGDNAWHAVSIANVTGMVFDRLETKFVSYNVLKGRREIEIRLAAYRHGREGGKDIVSASSSWHLIGNENAYLSSGMIRWIHGIPHGWSYARDTDVYTVELQLRYAVGPEPVPMARIYVLGALNTASTDGLEYRGVFEQDGVWRNAPMAREGSEFSAGLLDVAAPGVDHGKAQLSGMQYCVGLPASRVPDATAEGVLTYGLEWQIARGPSLTEPVTNL